MTEDILSNLNEVQRQAATCTEGPVLIIAGAGSGKTRVLTSRIAYLMSKGVPAYKILALTFTKKAAGEMRQRITKSQGDDAKNLCMGTFHSVFIKLMRPFASVLGYPDSFTILDEDGQLSCMKDVINDVVFHGAAKPSRNDESEDAKRVRELDRKYKAKTMLNRISLCKNEGITSAQYLTMEDAIDQDRMEGYDLFKDIFLTYESRCRRAGVMDFDDILINMDRLLDGNPLEIINRFDYILVDEYQDTNAIQYSILKKLTRNNDNICVVGDDSQSIYAFRGAKIRNIFNFRSDFPKAKMFKLEQNYRSTRTIVDAANRLIEYNSGRIPKVCFSAGGEGRPITCRSFDTERDEARYVADCIAARKNRHGDRYDSFAVLYRTNAQSRAIEDALIRKSIPYVIYSGTSFFDRMEVKDLLAYLKLALNLRDDESFKRICNKPARGISPKTLDVLMSIGNETDTPLLDLCVRKDLTSFGLSEKVCENLMRFAMLIDSIWDVAMNNNAYTAVSRIAVDSGLMDLYLADTTEEGRKRIDNIREMIDGVAAFSEEFLEDNPGRREAYVTDYMDNVMLLSNADTKGKGGDCVSVMTVHCAKGLEYDTVFVTGMEEGLFPLHPENCTREELEEERRLFYVAVTRARSDLHITRALRRMQFGRRVNNPPSAFIGQLLPDEAEEVDDEMS